MTAKRFIVIDAPYENGEPFLYKKMLDKTTKKEYDNTLKGIDDICDLANKLHEECQRLKQENAQFDILIKNNQLAYIDLEKENEQLKAQLLYDGEGVCNICKHQYLVENGKYYVARCEKEHEECSKVDLQYCEDFELVRDYK